jgi:hypothetical protein
LFCTYGLVIKGKFRGTTVALKRSLPVDAASPAARSSGSVTAARGAASMRFQRSGGSSHSSAEAAAAATMSTYFSRASRDSDSVGAGGVRDLEAAAAASVPRVPSRGASSVGGGGAFSGSMNRRGSLFDAQLAEEAPVKGTGASARASTSGNGATANTSGLPQTATSRSASLTTSACVLPPACAGARGCGPLDALLRAVRSRRKAASLRADFVQEMRLLVHLRHPHILTVASRCVSVKLRAHTAITAARRSTRHRNMKKIVQNFTHSTSPSWAPCWSGTPLHFW